MAKNSSKYKTLQTVSTKWKSSRSLGESDIILPKWILQNTPMFEMKYNACFLSSSNSLLDILLNYDIPSLLRFWSHKFLWLTNSAFWVQLEKYIKYQLGAVTVLHLVISPWKQLWISSARASLHCNTGLYVSPAFSLDIRKGLSTCWSIVWR